jgi:hypothetical protein
MIPLSLRFVALYAILLVPWAVVNQPASAYLRALGDSIYGRIGERRELDFESASTTERPYGLRVVIVNRSLMDSAGSGPVRNLDLDAAGLLARPMALIIALIACTPASWKRRLTALLWCMVWEQIIVLCFLGFCIWTESSELSLVTLTPFWKRLAMDAREMLVAQLGLGIPIFLWIVVMFRRGDDREPACNPS